MTTSPPSPYRQAAPERLPFAFPDTALLPRVPLVYRPPAPAEAAAAPALATRPSPLPAPDVAARAPQLDLDRLTREIWSRFDQRLRVEAERHGRI